MNRLLSQTQFGLRKGHSTTHALQHLVQSVNCALNSGNAPIPISIDVRKAFDTIDYQILLRRIRSLGINGVYLRWFESYLYGRSLKVVLNDIVSSSFL